MRGHLCSCSGSIPVTSLLCFNLFGTSVTGGEWVCTASFTFFICYITFVRFSRFSYGIRRAVVWRSRSGAEHVGSYNEFTIHSKIYVVVRVTTHNNPVLNHDQLLMFLCQNLRRSGGNRVYKIVFWIMVQEYRVGGRYDGRGGELTT